MPSYYKRPTDEAYIKSKVPQLYAEGKNMDVIAYYLNIAIWQVREILAQAGLIGAKTQAQKASQASKSPYTYTPPANVPTPRQTCTGCEYGNKNNSFCTQPKCLKNIYKRGTPK